MIILQTMKLIRDIIKSKRQIWKVPSKSDPDIEYEVYLDEKGDFLCTCIAGSFKSRSCSHREKIKKAILEGKDSIYQV